MKIKFFFTIFCAMLCILFTTACKDSPSDVVEKFNASMAELDFTEAKKLVVKEAVEGLDMIEMLVMLAEADDAGKADEVKKGFAIFKETTIEGEEINGDTAVVKISVVKDGKKENRDIKLVKVDGKWLISTLDKLQ